MNPPYATAGDGQIYLSWDPSNSPNVAMYLIKAYDSYNNYLGEIITNETQITLYDVPNGESFKFTVTPLDSGYYSIDDESGQSDTVTPTGTITGISPPQATPGNGSVYLSWQSYEDAVYYKITTYQDGYGFISSENGYYNTETTIYDLTNGVSYYFTVEPLDSGGYSLTGEESRASNTVTPYTVPNTPNIDSIVANNTQATINWSAPNNNGSAITAYTIIGDPDNIIVIVGGSTTSTTVTGLTNGKIYTFNLKASNVAGDSGTSKNTVVVPISIPITVGTNLIGNTLLIVSNTFTLSPQSKRIFDFNNSNNSAIVADTYIFAPFRNSSNRFSLSFKESTGIIVSTGTTFITRLALYIYTIYFISATEIEYSIYTWADAEVTQQSTLTITIPNNILGSINTFWLGRSAINGVNYYNGLFEKICLFVGNITDPYTTLPPLVSDFGENTWSDSRYIFGPLNNCKGCVVERFDETAASVYDIQLEANGSISGGYLNILGAFSVVPKTPTIGTATSSGAQATVSWTEPLNNGGSPITSYTVSSSPGGVTSTTENGSTTSIIVSGLSGGTYTFSVVATNEVGSSLSSAQSNSIIISSGASAPNAPTIKTTNAGNGNVIVNWFLPTSDGGSAITSYTVTSSPGGFYATVYDSTATTATVSGLTNGTSYSFTVIATNAVGNSSPSGSLSATPFTVPSAPTLTGTAGNGLVDLSWNTPNSNGRDISSYIIQRSTNNINWGSDISTNATPLFKQITGLTNGTRYYFRMYAINIAGNGAYSNVLETTLVTIPDAPTNVLVSSGPNIGQITVSWTPPISNGGSVITSYDIVNNTYSILQSVNDLSSSIIISDLSASLSYSFFVVAINEVGPSNPSISSKSLNPLTFSFDDDNNFVGGKLYIIHNYDNVDISFNWYSSINNSFTNPILLTNPNNRNYLFIRLEYQKLYIRCIVNYNSNTYTSKTFLIPEKYNPEIFDYNINVYTVGQKQSLFNTATFMMQNVNTPPVFNIDLNLNQISTFLSFNRSLTTTSNLSVNINGFETSWKPFGERLLEIVAMKIFGHPKARAAIGNDNDFYDTDALSIKVYDAFNNIKNEFGNYYMGIYDITEVNNNVQSMNISNFDIIFPFYLNGITTKSKTKLFQNGPNVGGSLLVNGQYNIPLLLTFN